MKYKKCNCELDDHSAYEYRGAFSCDDHFDEVIEMRNRERNEIMQAEDNKTKKLKGLDFGDNAIGFANRKLMSRHLEVASQESQQLRDYEGR